MASDGKNQRCYSEITTLPENFIILLPATFHVFVHNKPYTVVITRVMSKLQVDTRIILSVGEQY